MALESEYAPQRTSRLSSLPPEDRRVYKKILCGLIGSYAAIAVIMGAVIASHVDFQRATNMVVTSAR